VDLDRGMHAWAEASHRLATLPAAMRAFLAPAAFA